MVRISPARTPRMAWSTRKDRKSTRLNSSHLVISYAVFCLKKKKHPCIVPSSALHLDISSFAFLSDLLTVVEYRDRLLAVLRLDSCQQLVYVCASPSLHAIT